MRDRVEDIPLLVKHFIDGFSKENGCATRTISESALSVLSVYQWRGNIRELRNCIERMVVLSTNELLDIENIPDHIRSTYKSTTTANKNDFSGLSLDVNEKTLIIRALDQCGGNRTHAAEKLGISRRTLHRKLHTYNIG